MKKCFVNVMNYMFDIEEPASSYKSVELDDNLYYVKLNNSLCLNYCIMKEEVVDNNKYVKADFYELDGWTGKYSLSSQECYLLDDDSEILEVCS